MFGWFKKKVFIKPEPKFDVDNEVYVIYKFIHEANQGIIVKRFYDSGWKYIVLIGKTHHQLTSEGDLLSVGDDKVD